MNGERQGPTCARCSVHDGTVTIVNLATCGMRAVMCIRCTNTWDDVCLRLGYEKRAMSIGRRREVAVRRLGCISPVIGAETIRNDGDMNALLIEADSAETELMEHRAAIRAAARAWIASHSAADDDGEVAL